MLRALRGAGVLILLIRQLSGAPRARDSGERRGETLSRKPPKPGGNLGWFLVPVPAGSPAGGACQREDRF